MSATIVSEKSNKKAKAFLDTSSKLKHRHTALLSFVESATEPEQLAIFKDNVDYIVGFIAESVQLMFEKLDGQESAFEKALYGKERYEYLRAPQIFSLTIKPIHTLLTLDQQETVIEVIRLFLHPQNIHEIRLEGLRMLLFWMKLSYRTHLLDGLKVLYEKMIDLRAFTEDPSSTNFYAEYPFPSSWSRKTLIGTIGSDRDQAIKLLHDLLHWITWDPDPDRLSVTFSWVMLRDTYLEPLYRVENPAEEVQAMMVKFLACWIIRTPTLYSIAFQAMPQPGIECQADPEEEIADPVATYLWEDLMLSGEEEVEWCHRIVQHALSLPIRWYRPTIKQAIAILRSWVFVTKERRCDFLVGKAINRHLTLDGLNKPPSRPPTPALYDDEALLNSFVIRYLNMLTAVYQTRSTDHQAELLEAFKEVQFFFRTLSMQSYFKPSPETWSNLFSNQLEITNQFLKNSASIIPTPSAAESFAQQLIETLLGVWVRGQVTDKSEWQKLSNAFNVVANWPTVIQEWTESVNCLTKLLANLFSSPKDTHPQPKKVADSFNAWEDLVWTKENALFLWTNMIGLIGHPNDAVAKPETWLLIVKTISSIQHQLLRIRANQPYDAEQLPPVYELVPWLLDIADKGLDTLGLSSGTNLALDALCAVMLRRHDMPFPDTYYVGFYGVLIKGLKLEWTEKFPDHQLAAVATILSGTYQMLTLPLPGIEVVTAEYLATISTLVEHWDEGIPRELHGLLISILKFLYNAREVELLLKMQHLCQSDKVIGGVFVCVGSLLLAEDYKEPLLVTGVLEFVPVDGSQEANQVVLDCLTFLTAMPNVPLDAIFDRLILALKVSTDPLPLINVLLQCEPRINDDQMQTLTNTLQSNNDIHSQLSLIHLQHVRKLFPAFHACNTGTDHIEPILTAPEGSFAHGEVDACTLFLSIDRNVIISLYDQGDKVTIMARNPAGRFCWYSAPRFGHFTYDKEAPELPECVQPPQSNPVIPLDRPPKSIPCNDGRVSLGRVDMLAELLNYISEEHPNLSIGHPEFKVTIEPRTWPSRDQELFNSAVPLQKKGTMSFIRARQLLLSLGLTNHQDLHVLDKTPQLFRDVRGLDVLSSRECVKAGVIYVGPGQEDEAQILGNWSV